MAPPTICYETPRFRVVLIDGAFVLEEKQRVNGSWSEIGREATARCAIGVCQFLAKNVQ